jgi:hypothetical protein
MLELAVLEHSETHDCNFGQGRNSIQEDGLTSTWTWVLRHDTNRVNENEA